MQALHRCTTTMSRGRRQTRRKLLMQRRKTRATDAAAVNEITWRQVRRQVIYLNSNIRPLKNVRKLFWRLISVAELNAIAPNIWQRVTRINVNMQNTSTVTVAMDTVTTVTSTNTTANGNCCRGNCCHSNCSDVIHNDNWTRSHNSQ